jgi:hypothetical protein
MATAMTPIPTSRSTRRPMMFMTDPCKMAVSQACSVVCFRRDMKPALVRVGKLISTLRHVRRFAPSPWRKRVNETGRAAVQPGPADPWGHWSPLSRPP